MFYKRIFNNRGLVVTTALLAFTSGAYAAKKQCVTNAIQSKLDSDNSAAPSMNQNGLYKKKFEDRPNNQSENRFSGQKNIPELAPDPMPAWRITGFKKYKTPIKSADPKVSFRAKDVLNPAVLHGDDGSIYVLDRSEDKTGIGKWNGVSRVGLSEFQMIDGKPHLKPLLFDNLGREKPLLTPDKREPFYKYERRGIEDVRAVKLDQPIIIDGKSYKYHMTYTGYDGKMARLMHAVSDDIYHWKKLGLMFKDEDVLKNPIVPGSAWTKSGGLIQEKIGNYYYMYFGEGRVRLARSLDGVHWEYPTDGPALLSHRPGYFDQGLVEPASTYIDAEGIHLTYWGEGPPNGYQLGEAVFDHNDPAKLLRRSSAPFIRPDREFELRGQVDKVNFGQNMFDYDHKKFTLLGTADSHIGAAYAYAPVDFQDKKLIPIYETLARADISDKWISFKKSDAELIGRITEIHPDLKTGGVAEFELRDGSNVQLKLSEIVEPHIENNTRFSASHPTERAEDLVNQHRQRMMLGEFHHYFSKTLKFAGLRGTDKYNPTSIIPLRYEGKETLVMAVRDESRTSETDSKVRFVTPGKDKNTFHELKNAPILDLQDPAIFKVNGEIIVTGVKFPLPGGGYGQVFYRDHGNGLDHLDLKPFAYGPKGMKDIRLMQLSSGKILVATRPQGGSNGRGKVGFTVLTSMGELTSERLESATILEGLFHGDEWGGINQLIQLKNGKVGVLGHIARYDVEGNRHYSPIAFAYDPVTGHVTAPEVIAETKDLGRIFVLPKKPDLDDVLFSGGVERLSNGKMILTVGVKDTAAARITLDDIFAKWEQ